jgi:hypothetical protein
VANARRFGGEFIGGFTVYAGAPDLFIVGFAVNIPAGGKPVSLTAGLNESIFIGDALLYQAGLRPCRGKGQAE